MKNWAMEIEKTAIPIAALVDVPQRALNDGEVRLGIDVFALTANNITYAAFGDAMRYWDFFPAAGEGKGRLPVWGFADVSESRHPDLPVGDRIYGYFPAASELIVSPAKVSAAGFVDASDHRSHLPPAYNRYIRCGGDAGYSRDLEAEQMVLQPLYLTGWLLARYLRDEAAFGASRVYLTSASSKTAIGMARCLRDSPLPDVKICALTSSGSRDFVDGLELYDEVHIYSDIDRISASRPSAMVDFAGDASVNRDFHNRLGDQLKANIRVGGAHWEHSAPAKNLPGPRPEFFFAPDHLEKARAALGPGGFQTAYGEDWLAFARSAKSWLHFREFSGADACLDVYNALIAGDAMARDGLTIRMR